MPDRPDREAGDRAARLQQALQVAADRFARTLVRGLDYLPPGEIFVIPQGGAILFNNVSASRSVPFTGDMATAYAMNALRQQKAGEVVTKQITDMRKAAESKIVYNPAFKPPPEKKAAPAKAPAAPAASAPAAAPAEPAAK